MNDPFDLTDDPSPPSPVSAVIPVAGWLAGLNPEQREAVEATDGPVLVLSGAGTGKTRVLTTRLAYILATHKAQPWQVLAVTFTNRAASEMRERLGAMIGPLAESVWLGTFHAQGVRILRRHALLVGLKPNFTILDTDDQMRLLKQIMESEGVNTKKLPPQVAMGVIQRWKDRGEIPTKILADDIGAVTNSNVIRLYELYQERLCALNATDFGDLLLHCLTLFSENPEVLTTYQRQFRYVLVDEYQDTNVAQYLWLRLLARGHKNLCVVGDDDQSIYSWRGAEVGNILRFEHDFPGARVIRLERNYRSTPHILGAASGLIRHNASRLGKELRAAVADGMGDKVVVHDVWDGGAEARVVALEIEVEQGRGTPLSQMAILVRAGFQTREFEEQLIIAGIPYRMVGGPRFYERQEIRDAMAYLRLISQPEDDLAFERIVNVPKRGLGPATLQTLHFLSRAQGVALLESARRMVETDELKPKARATLRALVGDFDRWRALLGVMPHPELVGTMLDESGYINMWKADRSPDSPGRLENLKELMRAVEDFDSLGAFLEHVSLVMENDQGERERVSLMTLHGSKGLEFDVVFLPGWEEGLFPHQRAVDEGGLEEERRLAYVGITRARRRVTILFAASRRVYGQWLTPFPSRFIGELPAEHVECLSDANPEESNFGESSPSWSRGWNRLAPKYAPKYAGTGVLEAKKSKSLFQIGERVFHQKFGNGIIQDVDGEKLTIQFDKAGQKKVVDSFVVKA